MTKLASRPLASLTVADYEGAPVWQFTGDDAPDETHVFPIATPVANLTGRVVFTRVRLANGKDVWASLQNVDIHDRATTEQFLSISVEVNGHGFHLARYFDFEYSVWGPEALARFLGLAVDEVFPISFDLRPYIRGGGEALVGTVSKEPPTQLTEEARLALIFGQNNRTAMELAENRRVANRSGVDGGA